MYTLQYAICNTKLTQLEEGKVEDDGGGSMSEK
jgi:hypothetical protein